MIDEQMLTSVRLQNWRGHEDTTVPLAPFTILVGGNGVGKTSVLEALGEPTRLEEPRWVSGLRSQESVIRLKASHTRVQFTLSGQQVVVTSRNNPGVGDLVRDIQPGRRDIRAVEVALSPRRIAEPAPVSKIQPSPDGFGTATTIARWKLNDVARADRVLSRTKAIVPLVSDLGVADSRVDVPTQTVRLPTGGGSSQFKEESAFVLLVGFEGVGPIPAAGVSEGTLLTIALLTTIEARPDVNLILIDDLDRAPHVEAQAQDGPLVECG